MIIALISGFFVRNPDLVTNLKKNAFEKQKLARDVVFPVRHYCTPSNI